MPLTQSNPGAGVEGIAQRLKVDLKVGLTGEDLPERTEQFGNNNRPALQAKPWIKLFIAALDDFMLKVLMVAAVFSICFDMILADPHHRKHGKSSPFNSTHSPTPCRKTRAFFRE